jgi:hypothetical protein
VIIAGYHIARAIEPRELADARMAVDESAREVGEPPPDDDQRRQEPRP